MGEVYRARDEHLGREVALKLLPAEFLHERLFAERFRREAQLAAQLDHPNIVPLYAFGIDGSLPWMAMKFVSGGTLQEQMREGTLGSVQAVAVLRGVAEGLDHAHRNGIVHRDVKPQNILIEGGQRVYLADFGIARTADGSTFATPYGAIAGTPQYMAPEQARGSSLDGRCDIYALGVVAYEALTGSVPFKGDTPVAVLMKHVLDPVPVPPRDLVPEPVTRVILKSLAKRPEDRWRTAIDFVRSLEQSLAFSPRVRRPIPREVAANASPTAPTMASARPDPTPLPARIERLGWRVLRANHPWYPRDLPSAQWAAAKRLGLPVAIEDVAIEMAFVLIPGAEFWMGASGDDPDASADEWPRHRVTIKPFYLAIAPVTQQQWSRVDENRSRFRGDRRPVESTSWDDVQRFLRLTNARRNGPALRLPTESEWERAARGGSETRYWWGTRYGSGMANCHEGRVFSFGSTSAVGQYPFNPFGLLDVLGNVWEWCQDRWHADYQGAAGDGSAWESGSDPIRVRRGGSWESRPGHLRASSRAWYSQKAASGDIGFRCACDASF